MVLMEGQEASLEKKMWSNNKVSKFILGAEIVKRVMTIHSGTVE